MNEPYDMILTEIPKTDLCGIKGKRFECQRPKCHDGPHEAYGYGDEEPLDRLSEKKKLTFFSLLLYL